MRRARVGPMVLQFRATGAVSPQLRIHTRTLNILLQEGRMVRAAVNDIARENVTPGEVEATSTSCGMTYPTDGAPRNHRRTRPTLRGLATPSCQSQTPARSVRAQPQRPLRPHPLRPRTP